MSRPSRTPQPDVDADRRDANRMTWAFETPEQHWRDHDRRQYAYWRTRTAAERLAQAAAYRRRRHGDVAAPDVWTWRFLPPGEQ